MSIVNSIVGKWLGADRGAGATPTAPRRPLPEPGDIVRLALPTADNPNRPGTHFRYGIVINARKQGNGPLTLQVVPADALNLRDGKATTFHMADDKAARAAGLPGAASFDLTKAVIVEWSPKFGSPNERPLIGSLPDRDYQRFLGHYAEWRKELKIAANKAAVQKTQPSYIKQVEPTQSVIDTLAKRGQVREVWA